MYLACSKMPPRPPWPKSAYGVSVLMNLAYWRMSMPEIGDSEKAPSSQGSGQGKALSCLRPSSRGALVAWNRG